MNYSPYENIDINDTYSDYTLYEKIDLDKIYNKKKKNKEKDDNEENNNCFYNKREIYLNKKKCESDIYNKNQINYILNNNDKKKCKLIYNNRINSNTITSNKHNKQLNTRPIKTIPYRNPKTYNYNPECELMIKSGLYTSNKKSSQNTGEIEGDLPPMIYSLKEKIKKKTSNFDISRFQLSSRNLKGNKYYMENYKKKLNLIKLSLNKN